MMDVLIITMGEILSQCRSISNHHTRVHFLTASPVSYNSVKLKSK